MDVLHLYELDLKEDISILLNDRFFSELKKKIKTKYKTRQLLYNDLKPNITFESFRHMLDYKYQNFRPLREFLVACEKMGISNSELERNVVAYRTKKGHIIVSEPILPVKISPLFDMLVAHIMGDGCCIKPKGKKSYFNYVQCGNELRMLFLKKAEKCFGILKYDEDYFNEKRMIYLPVVISSFLSQYYSLRPIDFDENNAEIPEKMFNHGREHLLAFLTAIIIDEGHIDSNQIEIGLYNKKLISGLNRICSILGYDSTLTLSKRSHLYILAEGVKKFWSDYQQLKSKYSEVSMGYKETLIEDFIMRKTKFWRTAKQNETKNQIMDLLSEKPRGIIELAKVLQVSRQGIKYHIKGLEKLDCVKKSGVGYAGSYIYKLIRHSELEVRNRGRSRQHGVTDDKVINILRTGYLTTREISDKLGINRATTLQMLLRIEYAGKIKRAGKKILKTHPSIVWALK